MRDTAYRLRHKRAAAVNRDENRIVGACKVFIAPLLVDHDAPAALVLDKHFRRFVRPYPSGLQCVAVLGMIASAFPFIAHKAVADGNFVVSFHDLEFRTDGYIRNLNAVARGNVGDRAEDGGVKCELRFGYLNLRRVR